MNSELRRDIVRTLRILALRIEDGLDPQFGSERDSTVSVGSMVPEDTKIVFGYSTHGDVNFYEAKK